MRASFFIMGKLMYLRTPRNKSITERSVIITGSRQRKLKQRLTARMSVIAVAFAHASYSEWPSTSAHLWILYAQAQNNCVFYINVTPVLELSGGWGGWTPSCAKLQSPRGDTRAQWQWIFCFLLPHVHRQSPCILYVFWKLLVTKKNVKFSV